MTLRRFIAVNREFIDRAIDNAIGKGVGRRNDDERRLWILNDEGLYQWARSEGVRV